MGTPCYIIITEVCRKYRIFRKYDGFPEDVVPDIYILRHLLKYPDFFLGNMIFYAKLTALIRELVEGKAKHRYWEGLYAVGSASPELVDYEVDYEYTIRLKEGAAPDDQRLIINYGVFDIFKGTLKQAYEKYGKKFPNGCHIDRELVEGNMARVFANIPVEALVNALDR